MAKSAAISVRVDPELKTRIEAAALLESRTVSQWMELAALKALPETPAQKPRSAQSKK